MTEYTQEDLERARNYWPNPFTGDYSWLAQLIADVRRAGRKDGRQEAAQRLIEIGDEMEEVGYDCDPGWLAEKIIDLIAELESE